MLRATLFHLTAAAIVIALATQVPLDSTPYTKQDEYDYPAIPAGEDLAYWSLSEAPNPNATDHLVFETVHSLLQHWPNTRMRNGHNIVPGIIPNGTLLYHGRLDKEIPKGPEWMATDPEHSYLFTLDVYDWPPQGGGWHLTFMATRPLKLIYFDGNSAAKMPFGSMDTQDLLTSGKPSTGRRIMEEERIRADYLCKWGKKFGVDGFVRMEMDFEIIYCDFTSGLSVVSLEQLISHWSNPSIFSEEFFEVINSGAWHNRFPGETRIQLDLSGLVSFYDTQLAPSLVPIRLGQERWDHRAINVSSEDLAAVKSRLEANLIKPVGVSSGIDWKTLFQVIVDRYAGRLELVHYLLNSTTSNPDDTLDYAKKVQTQLRIMLTPYLLFSATPTDPSDESELDWTIPIFKLCATTHTHSMENQIDSMTDSEKLLLRAVQGTNREICRTVIKLWAAGVYAGIDPLLNTKESLNVGQVTRVWSTWAEELERLIDWLDWSVWIKCNPGCGFEETCYLPTWPVGFPGMPVDLPPSLSSLDGNHAPHRGMTTFALKNMVMENLASEMHNIVKPEPDEWIRPQPKCIRRVEPYRF